MKLKAILAVGILALAGYCNAADSNQKKEEILVVYFTPEISPQALVKIYKKRPFKGEVQQVGKN